MNGILDRLEKARGLPVLLGAGLVLLNFVVRCVAFGLVPEVSELSFWGFLFTDGNLLLHLGVIVGLLGVLIGDIL
jgi:membrane protein DedA with SNARE-associated domain